MGCSGWGHGHFSPRRRGLDSSKASDLEHAHPGHVLGRHDVVVLTEVEPSRPNRGICHAHSQPPPPRRARSGRHVTTPTLPAQARATIAIVAALAVGMVGGLSWGYADAGLGQAGTLVVLTGLVVAAWAWP